jgi:bifunctional ADP-heptose synthase (sugar kinase/adenylyltransferase)
VNDVVRHHLLELADFVRQFKGVKVAVLGDPMLDYYHFGRVERISPEAPVPIFIEEKIDLRDGGAGNVVANLSALGCSPIPIFPPAPHSTKHRYLVGSHQVFRTDRDVDHGRHDGVDFAPQGALDFSDAQALVISDYAKGWCTRARCQRYIQIARSLAIPIVVDPKGKLWHKYEGADVICPNEREFTERDNIHNWVWPNIIHKRGPNGLEWIRPDADYPDQFRISIFPAEARHVFDVTGAGDTVVAVLAAALAIRCEIGPAAQLANIAAGIVVGEVGTTPCSAAVLLRELER